MSISHNCLTNLLVRSTIPLRQADPMLACKAWNFSDDIRALESSTPVDIPALYPVIWLLKNTSFRRFSAVRNRKHVSTSQLQ